MKKAIDLVGDRRPLLCPGGENNLIGSVGQPRDKDNRASYVYVENNEVNFVRVEYDFETTMKKIKAIDELDNFNAERLRNGR